MGQAHAKIKCLGIATDIIAITKTKKENRKGSLFVCKGEGYV